MQLPYVHNYDSLSIAYLMKVIPETCRVWTVLDVYIYISNYCISNVIKLMPLDSIIYMYENHKTNDKLRKYYMFG
jgi:hypothetical protein